MATNPVKAQFPAAQNRPGAPGRKHKLAAQTHTHTTRLSRPLIKGSTSLSHISAKNCSKSPTNNNKNKKIPLTFPALGDKNIVRHATEAGRPVREKK